MLAAALLLGDRPEFGGIHRTFLQDDGSGKASLSPEKMSLGNIRGAGVLLSVPGSKVAVAEGIETGLSVQQATGIPPIAALSAAAVHSPLLPALLRALLMPTAPHD